MQIDIGQTEKDQHEAVLSRIKQEAANGALIRFGCVLATVRVSGGALQPRLLFARLDVGPAECLPREVKIEADPVAAFCVPWRVSDVETVLKPAMTGEPLNLGGFAIQKHGLQQGWSGERLRSGRHNDYSDWPTTHFTCGLERPSDNRLTRILIGADGTAYKDLGDVVREVSQFKSFHEDGDGRMGAFHVVVHETGVRLDRVLRVENGIRCELKGEELGGARVSARLLVGGVVHRKVEPATESITFEVPAQPEKVLLALVVSGTVIDERETFDLNRLAESDEHGMSGRSQLGEMISGGECATVEFKPWVVLKDRNHVDKEKRDKIISTAVAFANGQGGVIFLGLDDHGDPLPEGDFPYQGKKTPDEDGVRHHAEEMRDHIQKNVITSFPITVVVHQVGERWIAGLRVEKGEDRPYASAKHDIWFRTNATTRKATKTEVLELCSSIKETDPRWQAMFG